jgi:hypothetical protein
MVSIDGSRSLHFGRYKVDDFSFSINPDYEAAKYGLEIYQRVQPETGYRETELLKVIYNGENEITDLVKKKEREYLYIGLEVPLIFIDLEKSSNPMKMPRYKRKEVVPPLMSLKLVCFIIKAI